MELDSNVIQQFRDGDKKAFSQLFNAYYKPLLKYAFTFLNSAEEAEDIVQQCYIKLWEKREQDIHTSIRAMLYKMVHNASLNRVTQLKVRLEYTKDIQRSGSNDVTDNFVHGNELVQKVNEAIEKLPEQCKRIFKMSRIEEKKYQEIADELKLSIKTIENQMGKALKILRDELKDYLPVFLIILNLIMNDK